ncbi:MAG: hypothetical protein WBV95_08205 [Desulfobacterales bacterium]
MQNRYHPFGLRWDHANRPIRLYNLNFIPNPSGGGCRFLLQIVKRCGFAFFFLTTFPVAALGGSKTVLPVGRLVSVRRLFFAALWTLYIHEVMISIFLSTSSVSGRIASGTIITASPRKATVWKCLMLFATV